MSDPPAYLWYRGDCLRDLFDGAAGRPLVVGFGATCEANICGTATDLDSLLLGRPQMVAYIHPSDEWLISQPSPSWSALARQSSQVAFFVGPKEPPSHAMRHDGPVSSFCCSPEIYQRAASRREADHAPGVMAFLAADEANKLGQSVVFSVIHDRAPPADPTPEDWSKISVLIPHRGDFRRLERCLEASLAACRGCHIHVGFDEPIADRHVRLAKAYPNVRFWTASPSNVGPFVIRQFLIETCDTDWVLFQDSDDLPCLQRVPRLLQLALQSDADIVGCHELRIDELQGRVTAFRFPLDVNAALAVGPGHAQLQPTTLVRREKLVGNDGFTTRRRFGSDTEFLLRSHFGRRILNCDEFLYFRFRREDSLTTSPKTAIGTRFREHLRRIWTRDFSDILSGDLPLAKSGLRTRHRHGKSYLFTSLHSGASTVFLPRPSPR